MANDSNTHNTFPVSTYVIPAPPQTPADEIKEPIRSWALEWIRKHKADKLVDIIEANAEGLIQTVYITQGTTKIIYATPAQDEEVFEAIAVLLRAAGYTVVKDDDDDWAVTIG